MALDPWNIRAPASAMRFHSEVVDLRTEQPFEFIDISDRVTECLRRSGVSHGLLNVQTGHTTTAVVVNENEPGLLRDLVEMLERLAPREAVYCHDDFAARPTPVPADERENGHSHLRSVLLASSVTLNVVDGAIALGRWQRIFLVELDGSQRRAVSIGVMGLSADPGTRPVHAVAVTRTAGGSGRRR